MIKTAQSGKAIKAALYLYKQKIDKEIEESVKNLGAETTLRQACQYALLSGGKRFRPAVAQMVAKAVGRDLGATEAALAVEYFHCASLVADDLPCMDDDDLRRDKPSLHKAYGETVAVLASYALIAEGYDLLRKNVKTMVEKGVSQEVADRTCVLALGNATANTGIFGATGGQFLDLFPGDDDPETLREAIIRKTVSLFEISFVLGWLYGGGKRDKIDDVKQLAYHFGMAFQVADDMRDLEEDAAKDHIVNMAVAKGLDGAMAIVKEELGAYQQILEDLGIANEELAGLGALVYGRAAETLV